jgi:diguanylate cyclase (GGDEF)-like protein
MIQENFTDLDLFNDYMLSNLRFLDSVKLSICIFDTAGDQIVYMNEYCRKLFHIPSDAYIKDYNFFKLFANDAKLEAELAGHRLSTHKYYICKYKQQGTQKEYLLKCLLESWRNHLYRLAFIYDISTPEQLETVLTLTNTIQNLFLDCEEVVTRRKGKDAIIKLLKDICLYFKADAAYITKLDETINTAFVAYEWVDKSYIDSVQETFMGGDISPSMYQKLVHNDGFPFIVTDIERIKKVVPLEYAWFKQRKVKNFLWLPFLADGKVEGYLCLDNYKHNVDTFYILQPLLLMVFNQIAAYKEECRQAFKDYHDPMTEIWNRRALVRDINILNKAHADNVGVFVAKINDLKMVNYHYGSIYSDNIIRIIAMIFKTTFKNCRIYRTDSDEFVVISENTPYEVFLQTSRRTVKDVEEIHTDGLTVGFVWTDGPNLDLQKIIQEANLRMIRSQRKRSATLHLHADVQRLEERLLSELSLGRYHINLQEQVDIMTGKIKGAEALIRHTDSMGELVPLKDFLPVLEQSKLIYHLDFFVLKQICELLATWKEKKIPLIPLACNFSVHTIMKEGALPEIISLVDSFGIAHEYIDIEITESVIKDDEDGFLDLCQQIKAAGFKLSIDDFGSEYAFVQMLTMSPFNIVKFDKSMIDKIVNDKRMQMVCKVLMDVCHKFKFTVLAEGVETKEQLEMLRQWQCQLIQGYYFGRPMASTDFEEKYLAQLKKK